MSREWTSYDSAAESHNRLAVPAIFARPARDLVARMEIASGMTLLDVGTGSGVVAQFARDAGAHVIGIDPSLAMLTQTRKNGVARVVAGAAPGLPFPQDAFDRVTASFVLSHVPSYQDALRDMVRVLRPGGKLGVTAWGKRSNEFRDLWDELAEAAVDRELLRAAVAQGLPWEDRFTEAAAIGGALEEAGLRGVEVELFEYHAPTTIADFLAIRENSLSARFLRQTLDADGWTRFREGIAAEFHRRFQDPIDSVRDAWIATANFS